MCAVSARITRSKWRSTNERETNHFSRNHGGVNPFLDSLCSKVHVAQAANSEAPRKRRIASRNKGLRWKRGSDKSIMDELDVRESQVKPEARFIKDLGADSLDTVELVMRFEEEFGIQIPEEDAEKILTVRAAYDYIEQHASNTSKSRPAADSRKKP